MLKNNIDKNLLKEWYYDERNNINYFFNEIMIYLDSKDITFTISNQEFYDKFVEFLYSFNHLKKIYV